MSEPCLRCYAEITYRDKRQSGTLFGRQRSFAAPHPEHFMADDAS